jgi:hypothetical protein
MEELAYMYDAQVDLIEKAKAAKVKSPKLAKPIDAYIKEIEAQNSEIVFKGGDFYVATEERLTERIVELYGAVNSFPGSPGASQLDRINVLEGEINKVCQKFKEFSGAKLEKLNSTLTKAKVETLTLKSEEEFRKSAGDGGSSSQQLQGIIHLLPLVR